MSQDIIADTLNELMNAKRAKKESIVVDRHSKLLLNVLDMAKSLGYIKSYKTDDTKLEIEIGNLNNCRAIKPRFNVTVNKIDKYMRRYLPASDMGVIIISTNKGLVTHGDALEKKTGGALIAYFY